MLLIAGTDDMMVPHQQSEDLFSALQTTGLVSKKIYQNGVPKFSTLSAVRAGHGVLGPDLGGVIRNFLVNTMTR